MQQTIIGLYLKHTNYGDSSVILKLYSLQYGTVSFIVKGIKKKKGSLALLQPFHFIELSSKFSTNKEINFGNKLKLHKPSYSITSDIRKCCVAIFITDVLNKTLKETAPSKEDYTYIEYLIDTYDKEEFIPLFHHFFLIELIKILGILPNNKTNKKTEVLNISKGIFEEANSIDKNLFSLESSIAFKELLNKNIKDIRLIKLNTKTKQELLLNLVRYIEFQTEIKKGSIRSHKILETIFN